MADVLNKLSQKVMPKVFAKLRAAGLNDSMDVLAETVTSDGAGGQRRTETVAYSNVPCSYERKELKRRTVEGGKTISIQEYLLTFLTHDIEENRYLITPGNRLKVLARGNEPVKIFRIISMSDDGGITFQAICTKEN